MTTTIPYRFLVRGGTAAAIAALNEIPLAREIIYETDTRKWKVGNGATHYNSLSYYGSNLWQPLAAVLTQISALADPGADRILYWDNTINEYAYLTVGSGLTIDSGGVFEALGSGGGAMSLVGSATVAGAAATVITLSSLDLTSDGSYLVQFNLKNANASLFDLSVYVSADTTATNYDYQIVHGTGATVGAGRGNAAIVADCAASSDLAGYFWMTMDFNGKMTATFHCRSNTTTAIKEWVSAVMRRTVGNATGITLSGSVASCFAIGSTFKVFKAN